MSVRSLRYTLGNASVGVRGDIKVMSTIAS